MTQRTSTLSLVLVVTATALTLVGCGSGRITIDGYSTSALDGKRVFVVVPQPVDVTLTDQEAYAYVRGATGESARDQVASDLRTHLVQNLAGRLDSNTVLSYNDAPANGVQPLDAARDFTASAPNSWDGVVRGAREANADYLLVLNGITIHTRRTSGRGAESIQCGYQLLDPTQQRVMTTGRVDVDAGDVAGPGDVYEKLVGALVGKLPFNIARR